MSIPHQPSVLVACEMSGRVRDEFARRGWHAVSVDLLPCEGLPDGPVSTMAPLDGDVKHYTGDVVKYLGGAWDLVIAHPPCDHLSNAGARWWKEKRADGRQQRAAEFFMLCTGPELGWNWGAVEADRWAVENPQGIMTRQFREPDQVVEPWMFGDPLLKKTCLWTGGLPKLVATHSKEDYPELQRTVTGGGSWRTDTAAGKKAMSCVEDSEGRKRRHIVRSRTPAGFARAMAGQWGAYVEKELGL